MATTIVNPKDLAPARGYSHGAAGTGKMLYIAGQIGWDSKAHLVSTDLVQQFDRAMANLLRVVQEAGGHPEDVVKMNLFVLDKKEYRQREREIGMVYRKRMSRHYPAMTLVEVRGLYDEGAKVEIEAVAIL
ncbi:MAG: RidA family protein [Acidobacteriota bacterium]